MQDYTTIIDNDTAIDVYYYLRNGKLHCRYTKDVCIRLYDREEQTIQTDMSIGIQFAKTQNEKKRKKQHILRDAFTRLSEDRAILDSAQTLLKEWQEFKPVDNI